MGIYRLHKETMKAYIARLEKSHGYVSEEREVLWKAAWEAVKVGPTPETMVTLMEAVNHTVTCSCGRHASCWAGGTGPKMCETCMCS
jgi:hypothetical protein